jgi:hypothetical protein
MGYGLPAAIGMKRVFPHRTSVAICGDGDFLMTGRISPPPSSSPAPVIAIIANNGRYGTIRMHQEYPGRVSPTVLRNPDFAAYAKAFGGFGVKVEKTADFADAFRAAEQSGLPAIIHLKVDPDAITPATTLTKSARRRWRASIDPLHRRTEGTRGRGVIVRLAARHKAIVAAARALASESGMGAVQIVPAAERAGLTAGTVYRYFPSREISSARWWPSSPSRRSLPSAARGGGAGPAVGARGRDPGIGPRLAGAPAGLRYVGGRGRSRRRGRAPGVPVPDGGGIRNPYPPPSPPAICPSGTQNSPPPR